MEIKTITTCVLLGLVVITRAQGPAPPEPDLLAAIRAGNNETVARLLRAGADVNTRDAAGATALMHAAAFASTETMSLLVRDGANVNATNEAGATALMWATDDADKVQLLLEHDAEVNVEGPSGTTALLSAALRGKTDVMRMLISAGADLQKGTVLAPWPMRLSRSARWTLWWERSTGEPPRAGDGQLVRHP